MSKFQRDAPVFALCALVAAALVFSAWYGYKFLRRDCVDHVPDTYGCRQGATLTVEGSAVVCRCDD